MNIYIENSEKMMNRIIEEEKTSYFENRVNFQLKKIHEEVKEGNRNAVWIFNESYCITSNQLKNSWAHEFNETAKTLFTKAGYTIKNNNRIYW